MSQRPLSQYREREKEKGALIRRERDSSDIQCEERRDSTRDSFLFGLLLPSSVFSRCHPSPPLTPLALWMLMLRRGYKTICTRGSPRLQWTLSLLFPPQTLPSPCGHRRRLALPIPLSFTTGFHGDPHFSAHHPTNPCHGYFGQGG
jgi:hypothetical protein